MLAAAARRVLGVKTRMTLAAWVRSVGAGSQQGDAEMIIHSQPHTDGFRAVQLRLCWPLTAVVPGGGGGHPNAQPLGVLVALRDRQ